MLACQCTLLKISLPENENYCKSYKCLFRRELRFDYQPLWCNKSKQGCLKSVVMMQSYKFDITL